MTTVKKSGKTTASTNAENQTAYTAAPVNPITGKYFYGSNKDALDQAACTNGYTSAEWATLKQWNKAKRSIAKGENGTPIYIKEIVCTENGTEAQITSEHFMFNRCQLKKLLSKDLPWDAE